jgi:hypothetical protein
MFIITAKTLLIIFQSIKADSFGLPMLKRWLISEI